MRPLEEVLLCLLAHVSPKRGVGFPMALSRACFPKQLGRATAGARIGFGIAPRTQFGIAPRARISKSAPSAAAAAAAAAATWMLLTVSIGSSTVVSAVATLAATVTAIMNKLAFSLTVKFARRRGRRAGCDIPTGLGSNIPNVGEILKAGYNTPGKMRWRVSFCQAPVPTARGGRWLGMGISQVQD